MQKKAPIHILNPYNAFILNKYHSFHNLSINAILFASPKTQTMNVQIIEVFLITIIAALIWSISDGRPGVHSSSLCNANIITSTLCEWVNSTH